MNHTKRTKKDRIDPGDTISRDSIRLWCINEIKQNNYDSDYYEAIRNLAEDLCLNYEEIVKKANQGVRD